MGLRSLLFTSPETDPRLEACLVEDAAHIMVGANGTHVAKIQTALNQLTAGPGRENFALVVDGAYGPATASAVQIYKDNRGILQPSQSTADNIVGKRTMQSLDDEMDILENEVPLTSGLIAPTEFGIPHDHNLCPTPPRVTGSLLNGHATHWGTPINPKHQGQMINIFGEGETDYVGFVDFATEPQFANGRPLTLTLSSGSVSDIAMRNAPISTVTENEIKRLARPVSAGGCRLTYGSNPPVFSTPTTLLRLGQVVAQARVVSDSQQAANPAKDSEVWVLDLR